MHACTLMHIHTQICENKSQMYMEQACYMLSRHVKTTLWNNPVFSWNRLKGRIPQAGVGGTQRQKANQSLTHRMPLSVHLPVCSSEKQPSILGLLENNCIIWRQPDCVLSVCIVCVSCVCAVGEVEGGGSMLGEEGKRYRGPTGAREGTWFGIRLVLTRSLQLRSL